jgi:sphingomyelin phosphodiesterase acid-like 3
VIRQVEAAFAGIPVYIALGNNDSRCNHNRLDVGDAYLKATAQAVVDGLVGVSDSERTNALATYQAAGYYEVEMAAPMEHARLLVVDDIYMMSKFANCEADDKDQKGAQEQIAWLNTALDAARKQGDRVWVLGHVPPAVNPKNAAMQGAAFCSGDKADPYLASDDLANALISHADVIRLGVFGHTHMDELHLLGTGAAGVPIKVVGSISPVTGNLPSFVVAKVAPASATLLDYTVFEASNKTGAATTWTREYAFDEQYGESNFTAASLGDLIGRFRADASGASDQSRAYQRHFYKGLSLPLPGPFWVDYVCSLDHPDAAGFKSCVCAGK